MARIVDDFECTCCNKRRNDVMFERGEILQCLDCGAEMYRLYGFPALHGVGGPVYDKGLDRHFDSESDRRQYIKDRGLTHHPSADRHHGARNESHLNLGKLYSYKGQKNRGGYGKNYGTSGVK